MNITYTLPNPKYPQAVRFIGSKKKRTTYRDVEHDDFVRDMKERIFEKASRLENGESNPERNSSIDHSRVLTAEFHAHLPADARYAPIEEILGRAKSLKLTSSVGGVTAEMPTRIRGYQFIPGPDLRVWFIGTDRSGNYYTYSSWPEALKSPLFTAWVQRYDIASAKDAWGRLQRMCSKEANEGRIRDDTTL